MIICTLPCDRLLMSICCLPRLMSSLLCYYSCKVPFIRLAIWLALWVMCFSFSPIVCFEISFCTVHGLYTPTLLPMPMCSVLWDEFSVWLTAYVASDLVHLWDSLGMIIIVNVVLEQGWWHPYSCNLIPRSFPTYSFDHSSIQSKWWFLLALFHKHVHRNGSFVSSIPCS